MSIFLNFVFLPCSLSHDIHLKNTSMEEYSDKLRGILGASTEDNAFELLIDFFPITRCIEHMRTVDNRKRFPQLTRESSYFQRFDWVVSPPYDRWHGQCRIIGSAGRNVEVYKRVKVPKHILCDPRAMVACGKALKTAGRNRTQNIEAVVIGGSDERYLRHRRDFEVLVQRYVPKLIS